MITINDRDRIEWKEGMTVENLMNEMEYDYALITVTVDGSLVPEDDYGNFLLKDDSKVVVFHLAHGG